jgi:hypothetical protein
MDMYCHALLSKKYMGLISVHHDIMYRWFVWYCVRVVGFLAVRSVLGICVRKDKRCLVNVIVLRRC